MRYLSLALLFSWLLAACAVSQPTREFLSPALLPMPARAESALYLGVLPTRAHFPMAEIKGRVLVLEVFQSDCSLCQHQAGDLNELYRQLAYEGLAGQVKIIGFGYGDDSFTIDDFARDYEILYPLFADPRGEYVRVEEIPLLFILRPTPQGFAVAYEFHGSHPGTAKLLDLIRQELAD